MTTRGLVVVLSACACARSGFERAVDRVSQGDPGGTASGDAGTAGDAPTGGDAAPALLTVQAVYAAGTAWGTYLARDDPGAPTFSQTGNPCAPPAPAFAGDCFHAGELRVAVLPAGWTCDGILVVDQLGVFQWTCVDDGTPRVVSTGLKAGRGLGDLVTATDWRTNRVRVFENAIEIGRSALEVWWTNPVEALPLGGAVTLTTSSGDPPVYTFTSGTTGGVTIADDGISLVGLDGAELSQAGPNNCTWPGAGMLATCVAVADGTRFVWIEGRFTGADLGVSLVDTWWSRLHDVRVEVVDTAGVSVVGGGANRLTGVRVARANTLFGGNGLYMESTHGNWVHGVHISETVDYNMTGDMPGLSLLYPDWNTLVDVTVVGSDGDGIQSAGCWGTTWSHATVMNNPGIGLLLYGSNHGTTLVQTLTANNIDGLEITTDTSDTVVAQLATLHNDGYGVIVGDNTWDIAFAGNLVVGDNALGNCRLIGTGANKGLFDGTCTGDTTAGQDGSSSYPGLDSTAVLWTGRDLSASFAGTVTTDDSENASDTSGAGNDAFIVDWIAFESWQRTWGFEGTFPGPSIRNSECETCWVWDWRLQSTDPTLANRSNSADVAAPTFVSALSCPAAVHGDRAITDHQNAEWIDGDGNDDGWCDFGESCRSANTFLMNAVELAGDGIGDDDGLCESDERCVYSPHYGAYQGEGGLRGPCVFTDGVVSGVEMYGWAVTGT